MKASGMASARVRGGGVPVPSYDSVGHLTPELEDDTALLQQLQDGPVHGDGVQVLEVVLVGGGRDGWVGMGITLEVGENPIRVTFLMLEMRDVGVRYGKCSPNERRAISWAFRARRRDQWHAASPQNRGIGAKKGDCWGIPWG